MVQGNYTALILDDDVGVANLCSRLLEKAGFSSKTVNHPEEALDFLKMNSYDLLLSDVRMPDMNGFEVMDRAREIDPDLVVVIMTGYGTVETAIECLHRGADGLVLKPFSAMELINAVKRALRDQISSRDATRMRTLQPVFSITELIFTEKNPEKILDILIDVIYKNLDCAHAGIWKFEDDEQINLLASQGSFQEEAVTTAAKTVMELGQSVIFTRTNHKDIQDTLKELHIWTGIGVPHRTDRGNYVVMVGRSEQDNLFRSTDMELLAVLTRQGMLALDNAYLYKELRDQIQIVESSQQALIQAEKMAAVGRLTTSIAHEINNPLQSMHNCLHLVDHPKVPEDEKRMYMDLAKSELQRLMTAVRRMLDFYRPSYSSQNQISINTVIHRVLTLLNKQFSDALVTLKLDLEGDNFLYAVENQIEQVLFNLLLNSLEAIGKNGEISISTQENNGYVEINIIDDGPGIPIEIQDQIFEPFYSSKSEGLGLGLTVSYGIVDAHGGKLEYIHQENGGANFRISLPKGES